MSDQSECGQGTIGSGLEVGQPFLRKLLAVGAHAVLYNRDKTAPTTIAATAKTP
jgi:hypothetical protein